MSDTTKRALWRFVRGGLATAITALVFIIPTNIGSWGELATWINTAILTGLMAFIAGFLMAADKYIRDTGMLKDLFKKT